MNNTLYIVILHVIIIDSIALFSVKKDRHGIDVFHEQNYLIVFEMLNLNAK